MCSWQILVRISVRRRDCSNKGGEQKEVRFLNTTVVVCSANRPAVLSETIDSLVRGQSLPPREIIISVFDQEHVPEKIRANSAVRVVVSSRQALSVQRNAAVRFV